MGVDGAHVVVAVVLRRRGRIGLFRRSARVSTDRGRWHCITGYAEGDPARTAIRELHEETGLLPGDLTALRAGPVLTLADAQGGAWRVHTFVAETERDELQLNWEHDSYQWVRPDELPAVDGRVDWLQDVVDAGAATAAEAAEPRLPANEIAGRARAR